MKFSAHKLLSSTKGFKAAIAPSETQINHLKGLRKIVREAIRHEFSLVAKYLNQSSTPSGPQKLLNLPADILKLIDSLSAEQKSDLRYLEPKFHSQGSFEYKTLNKPCHLPPQQMDLDDGVYLPIEVLRDGPIIGKTLFFLIVDNALKGLVKKNPNWEFSDAKPTCARLNINKEIHIDVPLYAIPRVRHLAMESLVKCTLDFSENSARTRYLDKDEVYLAMRNKDHWIKSDPLQINIWFNAAIGEHDEILRRVCCYLKAWRDYHFEKDGPSSIALMKCVVDSFNAAPRHFKDDGEALLHCVKQLPGQLTAGVHNPLEDAEVSLLFPSGKMSESEVKAVIAAAIDFEKNIRFALQSAESVQAVINYFTVTFGSRIPRDTTLVETAISTAVLATPAKPQPQPNVPNMQAG
jgi:hypothetical protein